LAVAMTLAADLKAKYPDQDWTALTQALQPAKP
jgi:hypothetical protein